jgi:hypothetical protein
MVEEGEGMEIWGEKDKGGKKIIESGKELIG